MKKFPAFSATLLILGLLLGSISCKTKPPQEPPPPSPKTSPTPSAETQATETQAMASPTAPSETENCRYSTDPKEIKLQWTAFKTTQKVPVKGSFNTTVVSGSISASSLAQLATGLKMDIDGSTLESGDPGRNVTIQQFFFEKFNPPFKMSAAVGQFEGDDSKGNIMIDITMNDATQRIPFAYTATPDGTLTAKSAIDLMNFNLGEAFNSLHQACEVQHTGEDGVSKTWPDVDLMITAQFTKECSP